MEQVLIKKDGKGWKLTFNDGKSLNLTWQQIPKEWDGATVEVVREKGQVVKLSFQEKEITKQTNLLQHYSQPQENQNMPTALKKRKYANAPYNFVELNEIVVEAKPAPPFDSFNEDDNRLSGYIKLDINTQTPLYIHREKEDVSFFVVNNSPVIPGSSLRGTIRNLVEIATYSKFKTYDNRALYRRSTLPYDGDKVFAGYLYMNEDSFTVQPADYIQITDAAVKSDFNSAHDYVISNGSVYFSVGEFKDDFIVWKFTRKPDETSLLVPNEVIESYKSDEQRDEDVIDLVKSAVAQKIVNKKGEQISKDPFEFLHGVPVFYRLEGTKVISIGHAKYHRLPAKYDIAAHVLPINEHTKRKYDFAEAIFGFLKEKDNLLKDERREFASRVFFEDAATKNSAWRYSNDTEIPKVLAAPKPTCYPLYLKPNKYEKPWDKKDVPIRGNKLYWHKPADDVWKEDHLTFSKGKFEKLLKDFHLQKVDFKTALSEDGNNIKVQLKDLPENLWSYMRLSIGRYETQHTGIQPVKKGVTFSSRIRFENLTKEELGALLFVLDLPRKDSRGKDIECYHKLGMGKPLGLGSVQITPTLTTINRNDRYSKLFNDKDNGWHIGEEAKKEGDDLNDYKNAFAQYIDKGLNNSEKVDDKFTWEELWENERLQQLRTMLTFKHHDVNDNKWLDETRYMTIQPNEFKDRRVLPNPDEVVELAKIKKV